MSLQFNHEEFNTFKCQSILWRGKRSGCLCMWKSDVFILAMLTLQDGAQNMYQKRGGLTRIRYVNLTKIGNATGESMCKSLPGIHPITGCDTVSSFAGKCKLKAYKKAREKDS